MSEMVESLGGILPQRPMVVTETIEKRVQARRDQRMATKHLLMAWSNALSSVDEKWSYQKLRPTHELRPITTQEERVELTVSQKKAFGLAEECSFSFRVDKETGEAQWDSLAEPQLNSFMRLCLVGDEGSEGWTGFGFCAKEGLAIAFHRDQAHKINRLSMNALFRSSPVKSAFRKLSVVFRATRAPFGTGRFGLQLKQAHEECMAVILKAHETGRVHPMLELFVTQIVNDAGIQPEENVMQEVMNVLNEAGPTPR